MQPNFLFFDLGSTLIYSPAAWQPVFERADLAMLDILLQAGILLDRKVFVREFGNHLDYYYTQREVDQLEPTMTVCLREFLSGKGFSNVPAPILRAALDVLFAVTQTNWQVEEDAIPTLKILSNEGFKIGMISNAADDKNVQELVDQWELRPYFEFILTSAACGVRKPNPRIFQIALDHFRATPDEAVMIGDTLAADISGANRLGIYSIWITRRAGVTNPEINPQATIRALSELPDLLRSPGLVNNRA